MAAGWGAEITGKTMKKTILTPFLILSLAVLAFFPKISPAAEKGEPCAFGRLVPERKDDLAWENDLSAYRIYGPALKNSPGKENSGIDVWFKRVPYSIIDKWYREDLAGTHSYHADGGEGYDGFKVGDTRGGGGTALWVDGKLVTAGVYQKAKVLSAGPEEVRFTATYLYTMPEGAVQEEKTIALKKGERFFESRSVFTRDGKALAGLPVAVGLVTHTPQAEVTLHKGKGLIAVWDKLDGAGFGIGAILPPAQVVETLHQPTNDKREHALCIAKTDDHGALVFRAGSAWSKQGQILSGDDWLIALSEAQK
jgi:hypothetical protein